MRDISLKGKAHSGVTGQGEGKVGNWLFSDGVSVMQDNLDYVDTFVTQPWEYTPQH